MKMKKNDYSVDLQYEDEDINKKLYIEVKEVKFGFDEDKHIAEDNTKARIWENIINVIDELPVEKQKIVGNYIFKIPKVQFGENDWKNFSTEINRFLNENIVDEEIKEKKFIFKRNYNNKNKEIEIAINIYTEREFLDGIEAGKWELFIEDYETKGQLLGEMLNKFKDNQKLIKKVEENFLNVEKKPRKFPKDGNKNILLNIVRLPYGMEAAYNPVLARGGMESLMESFEEKSLEYCEKYSSVNESYLLYYFDKFKVDFKHQFNDALICVPVIGGLIKTYGVFGMKVSK